MHEKSLSRSCPICDSKRAFLLHTQPFVLPEGHVLPPSQDVVCCKDCGFTFADTTALQNEYDRYYARFSKYDDAQTSTGAGLDRFDKLRLQETARAIAAEIPNTSVRILDAGCAVGGLLQELKTLGCSDLQGLDPLPASAVYARENFDIAIHTGLVTGTKPTTLHGSFDLAILSHVLEHIRDLDSTFQNLKSWLKEGGVLYLEVPDAARYRDFIVAPFQDFNVEHINHFDRAHLDLLARRHGFEPISGGEKNLDNAEAAPYPATFGFYRLRADAPPRTEYSYDVALCDSLQDYISLSQKMLDEMNDRLQSVLNHSPVVVWGTGQLTLKLLAQTCLKDANIECFLDGNPVNHGKSLIDVPILAPEVWQNSGAPIVIASTLHQDAIARRIQDDLLWNNTLIMLR